MMHKRSPSTTERHTVDLPTPLPIRISPGRLARRIDWPEISRDLVEVSCAILLADRSVRRPGVTGPRLIHLRLPVRHPHTWERAARHVQGALAILGEDDFTFEFYHRPDGAAGFLELAGGERQLSLDFVHTAGDHGQVPDIDCVALFSGGLDSAAGAATFARQKDRVAYVTQYASGIRRAERLLGDIYDAYGSGTKAPHAQFYIRPAGSIAQHLREHSRRSRSFLFVSLALATAHALGAREVRVAENGVLALNLPFTPAMIPTRHAHSLFLHSMGRAAQELFGRELPIVNPFELRTKGEMSRIFRARPDLAHASVSCWNQQWAGRRGDNYGKGHCGYCVPCLVRRVSLEAADIPAPPSHFDVDVRHLARHARLSKEDAQHLLPYRGLMDFVEAVQSCRSWKGLVRKFPAIIESAPTSSSQTPEKWYGNVFRMLKRFANEVEHTFG